MREKKVVDRRYMARPTSDASIAVAFGPARIAAAQRGDEPRQRKIKLRPLLTFRSSARKPGVKANHWSQRSASICSRTRAPFLDGLGDVLLAVAPASRDSDRFAHNNLIAAISRPGDEKRVDRRARDLGENEGAIGQADFRPEKTASVFPPRRPRRDRLEWKQSRRRGAR